MSKNDFIKLPRLYVDEELQEHTTVLLPSDQAHYLKNVIRRKNGDQLRLFNGKQGEWLCAIEELGKREAHIRPLEQLRAQPAPCEPRILVFAPIKKNRMDFLIEKAVELGVTHIMPVLTQNTEVRTLKEERIRQQIIEAAEQCERLDIPTYSAPEKLEVLIQGWSADIPLYACIERQDAPLLSRALKKGPSAFLIGPEGGFTAEESLWIKDHKNVTPVSMGKTIYRAETASFIVLCTAKILTE